MSPSLRSADLHDPKNPEAGKVRESAGDVAKVFAHWQTVMAKPRASLDDKRRSLIRKALAHYSAADLCKAIDGCKASPFHMGINDRGTAYNALELIMRNAEKIDAFMAMADAPPELNRTLTDSERRANAIAQLTGRAPINGNDTGAGHDPFTLDM